MYYEKETNQSGTAFSSFLGFGYLFTPALLCELNLEANSNTWFDEDFRFGLWVSYRFRESVDECEGGSEVQAGVS